MNSDNTIFVQIASYRDSELIPTIEDCLAKAKNPDQLRFGICWQYEETESLDKYKNDERFRIIDCVWSQSKGVCWARHQIQKLYKGERYTLQLDSHHRFIQNWDEQLIEMIEQTDCKKPIITAQAPRYFPDQWVAGSDGPIDNYSIPHKIVATSFTPTGMVQLQSCAITNWQTLVRPLRARFLSCHFFFTLGEHCIECQYDPKIYFSEQEVNMTIRSYSHGYDLFHPTKTILWHEYERCGKPKHWDDHTTELFQKHQIEAAWTDRALDSSKRLKQLLQQDNFDVDLGEFGMGVVRSLEDYEKYCGIDFKKSLFHKDALAGKEPPTTYMEPGEWEREFIDIKASSTTREGYFSFFKDNGVVFPAAGSLIKPVSGPLSPGCQSCIDGKWSCIFITDACTRTCFYCPTPQHKKITDNPPNGPEQLHFNSVNEYIEFLETFDFKGVSFSGGEPFLVVDRMLEYISKIRQHFGGKHHIWAYTNGDLVTENNLSLLRDAGLNELRFDIAANKYDLTAVKKAIDYIETVTIEIPAIPEDTAILKFLLKDLDNIGVSHLNLHQLMRTDHNSSKLDKRCYFPVNRKEHPKYTPIMESELAALEIIKHAVTLQLDLGVNYCSSCYKARFQSAAHRKRGATPFIKDRRFSRTETGYLSQLALNASSESASYIKNNLDDDQWGILSENGNSEMVFSIDHLGLLLNENYEQVTVIYYEPVILPSGSDTSQCNSADLITNNNLVYQKFFKLRLVLENNMSAFLFHRCFIDKKTVESVVTELQELYKNTESNPEEISRDVCVFYEKFKDVEYLPINLLPYE